MNNNWIKGGREGEGEREERAKDVYKGMRARREGGVQ